VSAGPTSMDAPELLVLVTIRCARLATISRSRAITMSGTASSTTAHASVACVYLDIGIQVISGIVGACMCVLSGFGFDQLDRRANNEEIEKDRLPSNSDVRLHAHSPAQFVVYSGLLDFFLVSFCGFAVLLWRYVVVFVLNGIANNPSRIKNERC